MTMTFARRSSLRRATPKKYMVGGSGRLYAYADSLEEAKRAGEAIAKREHMRGSWNICFITIPVLVADAPGSSVYHHTGWRMYVPVRGTGMKYEAIVARIRKRHNVAPTVWTKNA